MAKVIRKDEDQNLGNETNIENKEQVQSNQDSQVNKDNVIAFPNIMQREENFRIFEYNTGKDILKLRLRMPTTDEMNWAEWEYAKVFNNAISEGIRPRSALISILIDNGINIDEMQREADDITSQIFQKETELMQARNEKDKEKVNQIKEELSNLRESLFRKNAVIRDYLRQSAESKAEESRDAFLMANILEYADGPNKGQPYYKAISREPRKAAKERYQKYLDDKDFIFKMKVSVEYMTFINGLPSDFMDKFPEKQKEEWDESETVIENPTVEK